MAHKYGFIDATPIYTIDYNTYSGVSCIMVTSGLDVSKLNKYIALELKIKIEGAVTECGFPHSSCSPFII